MRSSEVRLSPSSSSSSSSSSSTRVKATIARGGREEDAVVVVDDIVFDRKLDQATAGLNPYVRDHLLTKISRKNAAIIVGYVLAMNSEVHVSDNYRLNSIVTLKQLAESVENNNDDNNNSNNNKLFKQMQRQDIIAFLDRYRKPESLDPLHKWVGTCNQVLIRIVRFFKWLYYPDIPPNRRPEPQS